MRMMDEIRAKRDEIYAIARKHKAEKLWVFGSCARREERPDSDVDFLVKFNSGIGLFELVDFEREMADTIGRGVDLVTSTTLDRSPFFAYNARKDMVPL
jgi:predicted nucleotidyltransferase